MLIFVSAYAYYVDLCWYSNHLQKSSWQWNLISDDTRKRCRTNSGDSVVAAFDWSCLFRGFLKCGIHKSPQILVKCSSTWMTGGTPMTSETSIWGSWGSYSYEVLYLRHPLPCMWWTGGEVDHSVVFFLRMQKGKSTKTTVDGCEILHHLGLKPYKYWDKPSTNWCRISSIHSMNILDDSPSPI